MNISLCYICNDSICRELNLISLLYLTSGITSLIRWRGAGGSLEFLNLAMLANQTNQHEDANLSEPNFTSLMKVIFCQQHVLV